MRGELYLTPLVPLMGRGEGALVAVVSRERGEVYRLQDGKLHEVADRGSEQPSRHDQGGWSQANFQRHIDELSRGAHAARGGGAEPRGAAPARAAAS